MYISIYTGIHLYLYTHNYAVCCWEGVRQRKEYEKRKVGEEWVGNGLLQSEWFHFLIILPNFMIAKGLFDGIMKCLFYREFCWVMMMIKIKIIITLLFFRIFLYNDCVVKGYEV